jgi:hypothetical protein
MENGANRDSLRRVIPLLSTEGVDNQDNALITQSEEYWSGICDRTLA